MEFKDYYKILGLDKSATDKDIKKAYRKLARKLHPDINPGDPQAEERFKNLNEACEVLSDREKREKYDLLGKNWKQQGSIGGYKGEYLSDFFRQFKSQGTARKSRSASFSGLGGFGDFFNTLIDN
jgi:curved DNA-binding protein